MISFFDISGNKIPLDAYEDFCITHKLDGCDEMSFLIETNNELYPLLFEEGRVLTEENDWLIKKIDDDKIDCLLNFDFLKGRVYKGYSSETKTLTEVLISHLPEGWTIEGANTVSIRRSIQLDYATDFDVIYECPNLYGVYFEWRILEKRLIVYNPDLIEATGEYLTSELNLKSLSFKGESTEFATRLYAYGADGLTMENAIVDGKVYGLPYVDNKKYINKTVCAFWSDDRYTVPENLYADAKKKVETLSFPIRSYECSVNDLAKQNNKYSFLTLKMHKKLTLIDVERQIKVEHQIVEYKEYPDENYRNSVVLSCVPETIQSKVSGISSSVKETSEKIVTSFMERMSFVTSLMTSVWGSYFYSNGSELFIMDNPDVNLANIVWRWNVNGFAKSSTGINGPYTTALTFDDQFITNVIDAMVIRGSLIQADSITAEAISQSFKNEITDEINGKAESIEQNFSVANEELKSSIQKVEKSNEETKTSLSEFKQQIDSVNMTFSNQIQGGINLIRNSSGLNGLSDDWIFEGVVAALQDAEALNNTSSGSMFEISNGELSYNATVISGKEYTFSFKTKCTTNSRSSVSFDNGVSKTYIFENQEESVWREFSVTFLATSNTLKISAETIGDSLYVADFMLIEGNLKHRWTPAPNEIYTENVKVDRHGLNIKNSESSTETIIDHTQFAVKHKDKVSLTVNKDKTELQDTLIHKTLSIGEKSKLVPVAEGLDIIILD